MQKGDRKNQDEYFILYKGTGNEYFLQIVLRKIIELLLRILHHILSFGFKSQKMMPDETSDLIDTLYEKENQQYNLKQISKQIIRKSPKAKYQIFDETEFTRGREVLGDLIVHGMSISLRWYWYWLVNWDTKEDSLF